MGPPLGQNKKKSFHFIVVADDSYVICMIFRSQGGCGRQTAGSAGDDPEEEEVAGKEPRPESQEGCEVQGNILARIHLFHDF